MHRSKVQQMFGPRIRQLQAKLGTEHMMVVAKGVVGAHSLISLVKAKIRSVNVHSGVVAPGAKTSRL